jgi:hypothetical protein
MTKHLIDAFISGEKNADCWDVPSTSIAWDEADYKGELITPNAAIGQMRPAAYWLVTSGKVVLVEPKDQGEQEQT